ncbi:MAG TPA: DUF1572 family protein [Terriglobia bacterium]|nr:DUF1572 family protein [Terriglobia bacterium]
MNKRHADLTNALLEEARRVLVEIYPPRIARCLALLSEEEIWWRPNPASNSVGNMVLHLQGNVRQWIIAGLGGQTDRRDRDREFGEAGSITRRTLLGGMRRTVREAQEVLTNLRQPDLVQFYAGQIIYVTKLKRGKDLKFTRLPAQHKNRGKIAALGK